MRVKGWTRWIVHLLQVEERRTPSECPFPFRVLRLPNQSSSLDVVEVFETCA